MQLVAYGAQDIYLTGNPQITFFKVVYRRHTNFAMEAIEQTFNGVANFGNKVVCTIARNGDLVGKMYLEVDVNDAVGNFTASRFGHKLIKSAEVEIGGQRIDKHYGEWLDIWSQLSCSDTEAIKLHSMINGDLAGMDTDDRKVYIPLQFWFNRNPGLALPLIALQYHEVKVTIEFNKKDAVITAGGSQVTSKDLSNVCLFCDYIFLDTDERRRFAQVSHEYLIEQLQTTGTCGFKNTGGKAQLSLDFNHPVKELVWVAQRSDRRNTFAFAADESDFTALSGGGTADNGNWMNTESATKDYVKEAKLQLNGHDRFRAREGTYFRVVQPYQHHTGGAAQHVGHAGMQTASATVDYENGYIYCYSFALKPEEHQPSGTCNFSRIDNAVLHLDLRDVSGATADLPAADSTDVRVYAVNYNVLRIMSGMGGLAYSN